MRTTKTWLAALATSATLAVGCGERADLSAEHARPAAATEATAAPNGPGATPRPAGQPSAHTRVVWVQDHGDGADFNSSRLQQILMGFDSDDGRGERPILGVVSNYVKPLITPGGDRVVFSNRQEKSVWIVDWEGTGLRRLADGFALEVWRDPANGHEWVYSGTDEADTRAISYHTVRRHRLDDPEDGELVWDQAPVSEDNFQLSQDGRSASGVFPWPHVGLADLTTQQWSKLGEGCWTALAPGGPGLAWYFDGSHRNLTLVDLTSDARWRIPINEAPGIDGYEVYHPRWSNHARFMTMTGPYAVGDGSNKIRGGGGQVEIYLGQFAPDYRTVERWTRITDNEHADFYPDAWIDPSGAAPAADAVMPPPAPETADLSDASRRVVVDVRVRNAVPLPTPTSIAPYREGLLALDYEVLDVIEGTYSDDTIVAAHWVIAEGNVLPDAERPINTTHRLTLERYDDHDELEGRRLVMDVDDVTLPLYYDVDSGP